MPLPDFKPAHHQREHVFWQFLFMLLVAAVLLAVSTVSVRAAWDMYQRFDVAATEQQVVETELAALKEEHITMAATLADFDSHRGLEAAVRERFGVVRPGEGEIRIVRTSTAQPVAEEFSTNPFSKFFDALFAW